MNMESLRSLQKRIREATGADRELDFAICKAFHLRPSWCERYIVGSVDMAPRFTSDPDGLGACVALMRETLPVGHWSRTPDGTYRTYRAGWAFEARPLANDCLTFLDAICSAEISKLEAEQEKEISDADI